MDHSRFYIYLICFDILLSQTQNCFPTSELSNGTLSFYHEQVSDESGRSHFDLFASELSWPNFVYFVFLYTRGQVLPPTTLSNTRDVELINDGHKYILQVTRQGPTSYFLSMNDSVVEAETHRLTDGGLLVSYNGSSYTTYMKEQVDRYVKI